MPIQLDADLPAPLVPLAWLVGRWAGAGVVGYPTMEQDLRFGQEVTFAHTGQAFLEYTSHTWLLDEQGRQGRPLASETGYWRPVEAAGADDVHGGDDDGDDGDGGDGDGDGGDRAEGDAPRPSGTPLEVLLAHPMGYVELYVGTVDGPRVTLETDAVVRSSSAAEYSAATRMYGLVEGDLLWVLDMAAVGVPLRSHASARLKRVPTD